MSTLYFLPLEELYTLHELGLKELLKNECKITLTLPNRYSYKTIEREILRECQYPNSYKRVMRRLKRESILWVHHVKLTENNTL